MWAKPGSAGEAQTKQRASPHPPWGAPGAAPPRGPARAAAPSGAPPAPPPPGPAATPARGEATFSFVFKPPEVQYHSGSHTEPGLRSRKLSCWRPSMHRALFHAPAGTRCAPGAAGAPPGRAAPPRAAAAGRCARTAGPAARRSVERGGQRWTAAVFVYLGGCRFMSSKQTKPHLLQLCLQAGRVATVPPRSVVRRAPAAAAAAAWGPTGAVASGQFRPLPACCQQAS